MKENARIRFNPHTGEVEIEGSEKFVETNLNKLLNFMSLGPKAAKIEPQGLKARVAKGTRKKPAELAPVKRGEKRKEAAVPAEKEKKTTLFDMVVGYILESRGITTSELKEKTGLTENQIWSITGKAEKLGKIKREKRGIYIPAG